MMKSSDKHEFRLSLSCVVIATLHVLASSAVGQLTVAGGSAPSAGRSKNDLSTSISVMSIGIADYMNFPDLKSPPADAQRVASAYREVGGVATQAAPLLTDRGPQQSPITSSIFRQRVTEFLRSRQANETVVLFFAGHGALVDDEFYLVTSDFQLDDPRHTGIILDELRKWLIDCPAKTKIIMLDCCHSGAFGQTSLSKVAGSFRSVPGCVAITASSGEQASLEDDASGVFTRWLVRGLRGECNKNADDWIDVLELFEFVSKRTRDSTEMQQTPAISIDQFTAIPQLIHLQKPDRPSDRVGTIAFNLPATPETMTIAIDTIGRFAETNPRRVIGVCHWVQDHAEPNTPAAQAATELIQRLDKAILAGSLRLGDKDPKETPRR